MSETNTTEIVGIDGLVEFGDYLTKLHEERYRSYTFEMPDTAGRLRDCSLDDVLARFQEFCSRKTESFRVCICYVDYQHGTMGRTDKTFTRRRP